MQHNSDKMTYQRADYEKKLQEIAEVLLNKEIDRNISLMGGNAGLALFHFNYSQYADDEAHYDRGFELLENLIESIGNNNIVPTYANGLAGTAWAFQHIAREGFVELDPDSFLGEIDELLVTAMMHDIKTGNLDFLHGALGYGVYFLQRLRETHSPAYRQRYLRYTDTLLTTLEKSATSTDKGLCWISEISPKSKIIGANMGLAHGMPAIISFLIKASAVPELEKRCLNLIKESVKYIVSMQSTTSSRSLFPNWVEDGKPDAYESILAWCYGDLGIGLTLKKACSLLGSEELRNLYRHIAVHSTRRGTYEAERVKDASICHGAFGISHLMSRLNEDYLNHEVKEASGFWLQKGMSLALEGKGVAGFRQWRNSNGWSDETGFLEGACGIGLVLVSMLSGANAAWDEALLIS